MPKNITKLTFNFVLTTIAASLMPMAAHANQCDAEGRLRFLGTGANGEQSVWVSRTSTGAFRLDAAQGNQTVDTWSKNRRGLHLSLSPVVSNGNGGTHKLYTSGNCLLDTQNQKNGFVFPPGITRPPSFRPLIPLTPSVPVLPELPGGVTPPIGTLPPGTLTPTVPTKPNLPGGVTPPIGTLPPDTLTPGGVQPPIATLPEIPVTGPTKTTGEIQGALIAALLTPTHPCRGQRPDDPIQVGQLSDCYAPEPQIQSGELPLTAGRELVGKSELNIWADGSATRLRDTRDGMDTRGHTVSLSMGLDRVLNDDLVAGLQLFFTQGSSNSFGDTMQTDATSYSIGPYISYSLSQNWLLYGAIGFGIQTVDTQIVSLRGTSDANQYSLNLQTEGQYALGSAVVRPKVQLSHTYNEGDTYQLKGVILNTPLTLNMRNQSFNYGVVQSSAELNRTFDLGNNQLVMPFFEAGVYYEYARPSSGQHLTSELTYANSRPWGGILRAGARSLLGKATMASFDVANQTVGVNDLNIWEMRLLISHSF